MFSRVSLATVALLLAVGPARAADVWSDPFPGIRYLYRSTSEPKRIHALIVDLDEPGISLRASKASEKGKTPSQFSDLVGAAAVVNGDFYNTNGTFQPVGLAVGAGEHWPNTADSTGHRFLACTADNECTIDTTNTARTRDASWRDVVGGNRLIVNAGVAMTAQQDTSCGDFCTTAHPRTAVGLSQDGRTLILVMVEGRQTPILGMSTSRLGALMVELGAYHALNLDGGGSSGMVVDGELVNNRPSNEPSERRVANSLAVLYDDSVPATTGVLKGFIRAEDIYDTEAGIPGVTVSLSTGATATTASNGLYSFAAVPPGTVTVTASKAGWETVSEDKVVQAGVDNWKSMALFPVTAVDAGPTPDAAPPAQEDAGAPDAGTEPLDAGAPDFDAGVPDAAEPVDAGSDVPDSGDEADAAITPDAAVTTDAAVPPDAATDDDAGHAHDAGTINTTEDAGTPVVIDEGGDDPEPEGMEAAGCSTSTPSDVAGLLLLAFLLRRKRTS